MSEVLTSAPLFLRISATLRNTSGGEAILIIHDDQATALEVTNSYNSEQCELSNILGAVSVYSLVRVLRRGPNGSDSTAYAANYDLQDLLTQFPEVVELDFQDVDPVWVEYYQEV